MTEREQREAAAKFASYWAGRGDEKGDTHSFWLSLLQSVYGVEEPHTYIAFEKQVRVHGSVCYIDAYIGSAKVLIEQKSADVPLDKAYHQSGGAELTPYEQAKRYDDNLPRDDRARWIVICNFASFLVFDMNAPGTPPAEVRLAELPKEFHRLGFLASERNVQLRKELALSMEAGDIVRDLYDRLLPRYIHPEAPETLKALNKLCVRLVFCLYAEDAGLFGAKNQFHDYLQRFDPQDARRALLELFHVLDTPVARRDPYLEPSLAAFPYVNGGLFAGGDQLEVPTFDLELKTLLLARASDGFDWSAISPTIFGAVFESTLNPETRRSGGMHYTSVENIHKVIDPLFLDSLRQEFGAIRAVPVPATRRRRLLEFQEKLASLRFLDPACGSGNFLTETYLSLRRLENAVLELLHQGQMLMDLGDGDLIRVSIGQFYGIEVNDFAVAVARTALWIAEAQMFAETQSIVHSSHEFFPLKAYATIVEGDALAMEWSDVVPRERLSYIMGNPPFVGARLMSPEQKRQLLAVFGEGWQNAGNLDYVGCWYKKAAEMMKGTTIRTALVSTNSICQGAQVADLWKGLVQQCDVHIDFAYRTFRWDSEADIKAHVHCVVIGFSAAPAAAAPFVVEGGRRIPCTHLNPYLVDAEDIFIDSRSAPICDVPETGMGNQPIDDGNYLFLPEEKEVFLKAEPAAAPYFRPWYGAQEFIAGRPRWCLWLGECSPAQLRAMPRCLERVANVRAFRLASSRASTRKLADRPTRFQTENMPEGNYIVLPEVSSEKRFYVPIGFKTPDVLCSNKVRLMPNATLYHFGVLTSVVHMAWMRVVTGRLKSDYSYSINIVYNNYPWPEATEAQRAQVEKWAQAILDARALYPECTLADLYDPVTMPPELRSAHHHNDDAVLAAYGLPAGLPEEAIVAELFRRYQALAAPRQ